MVLRLKYKMLRIQKKKKKKKKKMGQKIKTVKYAA